MAAKNGALRKDRVLRGLTEPLVVSDGGIAMHEGWLDSMGHGLAISGGCFPDRPGTAYSFRASVGGLNMDRARCCRCSDPQGQADMVGTCRPKSGRPDRRCGC